MPTRGALSVTVPGAVGGWFALHQRFGRLELSRVARDAIQHARAGFRVTPFVSAAIQSNARLLAELGGGAVTFLRWRTVLSALTTGIWLTTIRRA